METQTKSAITVEALVKAPIAAVWTSWTSPESIMQWNTPSVDWHCPYAENTLETGKTFRATMAAKDGSMSFDFEGTYTAIEHHRHIAYVMGDGRRVTVTFEEKPDGVSVRETFDPENINPEEMQRAGWQAILDNFKKHTEQ